MNLTIFTSVAAALLDTSDGDYFTVPAGTAPQNVQLYKNVSGAAELQTELPSVENTNNKISAFSDRIQSTASYSIGAPSPSAHLSGAAGTFILKGKPANKGFLDVIEVYSAEQTAKVKIFRATDLNGAARTMAYEFELPLLAGLNRFSFTEGTLAEYTTEEGDLLAVYFPTSTAYKDSQPGSVVYDYQAGDFSDPIILDGMGGFTTLELQIRFDIVATSSPELPFILSERSLLGHSFSLGAFLPHDPGTSTFMPPHEIICADWEFRVPAVLKSVQLYSAVDGTGVIVVLAPYLGGYQIQRRLNVQFSAGAASLLAGVDFPSDVFVPKDGLIGFVVSEDNTVFSDIFNTTLRVRKWLGWPEDGVLPSYSFPVDFPYSSKPYRPSGVYQVRYNFEQQTRQITPAQYVTTDNFNADSGPVNFWGSTWEKSAGAMTSTGTGLANALRWAGGATFHRNISFRVVFEFMEENSTLLIFRQPEEGGQGSLYTVSMSPNVVSLHEGLGADTTIPPVYRTTIGLQFILGRKYIAELVKEFYVHKLRVTDTITSEVCELLYDGYLFSTTGGMCYGEPGIAAGAGQISVHAVDFFSPVKAPKVLVLGDSVTEGTGAPQVDGWAYLVEHAVPAFVSARGGDTSSSVSSRIALELAMFPTIEYAVIDIGANDHDMERWQKNVDQIQQVCETYAVTAIFCTCMRALDLPIVEVINPYIRDNFQFIDMARALTVDGDGETFDSAKFVDDVHPNSAGYLAMFNRAKMDAPELFD